MPPLKGIDRGINGALLQALEECGHCEQIIIADASLNIPHDAYRRDYQGDSSAQALLGIIALVPVEEGTRITCMAPDPPARTCKAMEVFRSTIGFRIESLPRNGDHRKGGLGFYDLINDSEMPTLFVRTRDILPFASARFLVGHAQEE
jgi:hypothetical protein